MIIIELIYNLALLVALSVVSSFIGQRWQRRRLDALLQGLVFGSAAVVGMLHPLVVSAGLIFDGRSVVISLCGLFFGPLAVGVAAAMAAICRIQQGGPGALMGLLVITSSAVLGLAFHFRQSRPAAEVSARFLLLFGLLVHVVMLLLMFSIPGGKALSTLKQLGLPILLTYPLATVLIGKVLSDKNAQGRFMMALRESTESFRTTLYSIGDAVISTDSQGRVQQMNPVAERLTGWLEAEARNQPLDKVFHIINEKTRDVVENPAQRVLREGEVVGLANHTLLITRDGAERPIADSGAPIRSAEGEITGVVLVFRDQSADRAAQKSLRESESRFRLLFEHMPLGYQSLDADGRFIEINPEWLAILGYERDEVIGHWFGDFLPPAYAEAFRERFPKFKEAGEVHNEFDMIRKDGSIIRVAFDGKIGHDTQGNFKQTHCILNDITRRKKTEEALRLSEAKYRLLHESMRDAFASIDMDGKIKEFNDAFCQTVGYSPEELRLLTYLELTPEKWHAAESRIIREQVLARGYSEVYEKEYRRKDGTIFPIEIRTILLRDAAGQPCGMWGLIRDITERKQAEALLLREQGLYKDLVNTITVGTYRLRMGPAEKLNAANAKNRQEAQYVIEMVSDRFTEITGITMQEFEANARCVLSRIHPDDIPEFIRRNAEVVDSTSVFRWEGRMLVPDKGTIWVHLESIPRPLENGEVMWTGIVYDITERKQAENALRESEEHYRLLFNNIHDAVFLHGFSADDQQPGHFLQVNDVACQRYGYSRQEWLQMRPQDLDAPEGLALIPDVVRHLQSQGHATWEGMHKAKDGRLVPVEISNVLFVNHGTPVILSVARDITERNRAEAALRHSEEKYRNLFETSRDALMTLGPPSWAFTSGNPATLEMYGAKSVEEFISYTPGDLSPQRQPDGRDSAEKARAMIEKAMHEGSNIFEWTHKRTSGEEFPAVVLLTRIEIAGKQFLQATVRDITEQKRAEQEREKLQSQLLQAQKMESVGRLAGGVAHDFNNMLGVIMGHTDMALEQVDSEAHLYHDLLEIQKAARRSADLTRQLLAFARKQTVSPKVLDLNATVASVLKMLQRLIGENIELAWQPGPELWPVKMDPSQVDQILANLAVNARDAITGVGHLTIHTENVTFDESYCLMHDGCVAGDYVLLAVSDTGAGMDKETLEHVFEPFFTTKDVGKGTGLGLSMVYGAIKQNRGFISVYSEPGQGTIFKIYLPREEGAQVTGTAAGKKPDHGTETILLAEDEEAILRLGTAMLQKLGYTVLAARSPVEALTLAKQYEGPIHLLITDVVMPGMNGKELQERLTALRPGINVLFMSGYTSDVIAHQGVIDEGVAFLQKPFSVSTLAQKVRDALR